MTRKLADGSKLENSIGPGEHKRRLREKDRPPKPKPDRATTAWRHAVHAAQTYDNPAAEVLDVDINRGVQACGGWDVLVMLKPDDPSWTQRQREFLDAYTAVQTSAEPARAAT